MNVTHLIQDTSLSQYFSAFSRAASTSLSRWSGLILASSATALIGLGAYRWKKSTSDYDSDDEYREIDSSFIRIKERIQRTYGYVFGGFTLTAAAATLSHVSGLSAKILNNNSYLLPIGLTLTTIVSLVTTIRTSSENQKTKHVAWTIFNASMGLTLSPLGFFNKALLAQAAGISLGLGGLLTLAAYFAPDRRFIEWEGPLMAALTSLSIASAVAIFFPNSAFAYGIDRASLYGGLLIFSGFLMSSTQQLLKKAEEQSDSEFDPINSSLNIYLDGMNIFIRILRILAENKRENKE